MMFYNYVYLGIKITLLYSEIHRMFSYVTRVSLFNDFKSSIGVITNVEVVFI